MAKGGARTWYFPDGYLPAKTGAGPMEAHESLMLMNVGDADAVAMVDIYFSDRPPVKAIKIKVPAERIIALRTDKPEDLDGAEIPLLTQYALRVSADRNIVAQFGRLDTTQINMAYYGCMGYHE